MADDEEESVVARRSSAYRPLLVDDRTGAAEYGPQLRALGARTNTRRLDSADFAWCGDGPEGRPVWVGVECKLVPDLLQSLDTGRLVGRQLPLMREQYEVVILLVAGSYRCGPGGLLQIAHSWKGDTSLNWRDPFGRRWMYAELVERLSTLRYRLGVRIEHVPFQAAIPAWVHSEWRWWMKGWDHHKSHQQLYSSALDRHRDQHRNRNHDSDSDSALDLGELGPFYEERLVRNMAAQIPAIGWTRSAAVAEVFDSPAAMVQADEKRWMTVKGIGKGIAGKVVKLMRGEKIQ